MRMHVSQAKRMALLGVMAAVATVFLLLGTIIPVNTLFFTSASAFLAGVAVVMFGGRLGFAFYAACGGLDFLLNPNKLHVFLYLMLAGYTLLSEIIWKGMEKMSISHPMGRKQEWIHRGIRFMLFLVLYIPLLLFVPELLASADIAEHRWFFVIMMVGGLIAWIIYDLAYVICKRFLLKIWKVKTKEGETGGM